MSRRRRTLLMTLVVVIAFVAGNMLPAPPEVLRLPVGLLGVTLLVLAWHWAQRASTRVPSQEQSTSRT